MGQTKAEELFGSISSVSTDSLLLDWREVWQVGITGFIAQRQAVLSVKCDPGQRKLEERKEIDSTVNPAMKSALKLTSKRANVCFCFFKEPPRPQPQLANSRQVPVTAHFSHRHAVSGKASQLQRVVLKRCICCWVHQKHPQPPDSASAWAPLTARD